MSIENNIIMFDTNIWLKILNENGRMTNRNKIVNEDLREIIIFKRYVIF